MHADGLGEESVRRGVPRTAALPYLISRIPLIDTFEKIIAYAKSHKEVWFARRGDIAAWARKYYEGG